MAFRYFAYGSNMLSSRLRKRCPSATKISNASIEGFQLVFTKPSKDGSGKGGLVPKTEALCHGVLFELSEADLPALDRAEGAGYGYERVSTFTVIGSDKTMQGVTTYLPTRFNDQLNPYDWYLALVIAGAQENKLPSPYIDMLKSVPFEEDPKWERKGRLTAVDVIRETGIVDYRALL